MFRVTVADERWVPIWRPFGWRVRVRARRLTAARSRPPPPQRQQQQQRYGCRRFSKPKNRSQQARASLVAGSRRLASAETPAAT